MKYQISKKDLHTHDVLFMFELFFFFVCLFACVQCMSIFLARQMWVNCSAAFFSAPQQQGQISTNNRQVRLRCKVMRRSSTESDS